MSPSLADRPTLHPSAIGQFFRLQSCPMYLQWEYDSDARAEIHRRDWETKDLSPVLADEGQTFEEEQLATIVDADTRLYGPADADFGSSDIEVTDTWDSDHDDVHEQIRIQAEATSAADPAGPTRLLHQPVLSGTIGAYDITGKADILALVPTTDGVEATLFEVKSSSEQKVHHRYQGTIYAVLLEQMLASADVALATGSVATKIVTPENEFVDSLQDPDGFDTEPYRAKLQLKLRAGGSFDQTILDTEFDQTTNRIAQRCAGCEYEPLCMTRGVESAGLELLGLQAGAQEALHELGIHDLLDFVDLFDHPDGGSVHWEYSALEPQDEELVQRVRQEADISNLQKRAEIAYRFLAEIDEDYGYPDGPDLYPYPLRGTGNNLPEDDHGTWDVDWTEWYGPDYPSQSLVRVYLYVQQDHAQNRVTLLSGYVACSLTDERRQVTELPETLPTDAPGKDREEQRLFTDFFEQLAEAITTVAPSWDERDELTDVNLDPSEGFLHLFLYSDGQRDALMEAVRRHPAATWRRPLRTLLGLRAGIDQEMTSVLQEDFRQRWALRFPGLGTIQTTAQFRWDSWFSWQAPSTATPRRTLDDTFATGLFDSSVRYYGREWGVQLDHSQPERTWTSDDKRLARNVYPIKSRETDSIPIEYIWGVHDRITPEAADDPSDVEPYLYRTSDHVDRIDQTDLRLMAERFARAVHHIERTIENTNKYANDRFITKEPINLDDFRTFEFDQRSLDEVCVEYQQLEYHTIRTGLEDYYCQPLAQRIDSGSSLRFRCTTVDESTGTIRGQLLRSDGVEYDPSIHGGVIGGPLSVTGGDFMVVTRLDPLQDRPELTRRTGDPESIANSTTAIISDVDEDTGEIVLSVPFERGWPNRDRYTVNHRGWSTDLDDRDETWTTYIGAGEEYVVDPMVDQITQNRAYEALVNGSNTPVQRWLQELYAGEREEIPIDQWDPEHIDGYIDRMAASEGFARPNTEQAALISDVGHGIVTLQGPPGTGKTRYTVAPAVLARVHSAMEQGQGFYGVVSAVSHNAVNEALKSVVALEESCPPGDGASDVDIIRVCSSADQGIDHPRVTEINYNGASQAALEELYDQYFSLGSSDNQQVLFFGPPVSIRSCFNAMLRAADEASYDDVANMMSAGGSTVFDLAVIDEASMIDLPLCFLLGSFMQANGQLLLVGDHRQMQPIQQHEWEDEDREPIERHTPFLSALDFLRYLRGEEVDLTYVSGDPPDIADPDAALPVHRLTDTFRLPPESARLHTDLFYSADGIELESAAPETDMPSLGTGAIADILNSDDRITLILHDGTHAQKTNPIEQALITELLDPCEITAVDAEDGTMSTDGITAGVVVPFRAQRRDVVRVVPDNAAVDTVERFQGGERDLMMLSMTASDRGYISQISEFLLDPHRFNVGASRMKRKLVVIAAAGIFEESSDDVSSFDDQEAWIHFYERMGGLGTPTAEYTLSDLVSPSTVDAFLAGSPHDASTEIEVYSGFDR